MIEVNAANVEHKKVVHGGHDDFSNNVDKEDDILSKNEKDEDILLSDGDCDINGDGDGGKIFRWQKCIRWRCYIFPQKKFFMWQSI